MGPLRSARIALCAVEDRRCVAYAAALADFGARLIDGNSGGANSALRPGKEPGEDLRGGLHRESLLD